MEVVQALVVSEWMEVSRLAGCIPFGVQGLQKL